MSVDTIALFKELGIGTEEFTDTTLISVPSVFTLPLDNAEPQTSEDLADIHQSTDDIEQAQSETDHLISASTTLTDIHNQLLDKLSPGLSVQQATTIQATLADKYKGITTTSPLPLPEVFAEHAEEATDIALEGFGQALAKTGEFITTAFVKLWEMIKKLFKDFFAMVSRLVSKGRDNAKAIIDTVKKDPVVEDIPENRFIVDKEVQALYRHDLKAFSSNIAEDVLRLNAIMNEVYIPYLKAEIEVATKLLDIYAPMTHAAIDNDLTKLAQYEEEIDRLYANFKARMITVCRGHEGEYIGGLSIYTDSNEFAIQANREKVRETKVEFLALSARPLDILNSNASQMLDTANNELNRLYKEFERVSQKGVDVVVKAVDDYRRHNKFSKGKANRVDNLTAKHFAHFTKSSSVISACVNAFIKTSYVITNDFVPKNIAILNNQ